MTITREHKNEGECPLLSRPEHLSKVPVDATGAKNMQDQLSKLFNWFGQNERHDSSTNAGVSWYPSFTLIKTLNVASKEQKADVLPCLTNVYFTNVVYSEGEIHGISGLDPTEFHFFLCYTNSLHSRAKLQTSLYPDFKYSDNLQGCLWINAMNNWDDKFRHGSLLIQLAVEYSIQQGFDGRVALRSNGNSNEFYSKIGFINNKDNLWILSSVAISIWKEKIAKNPILSKKEIDLIVQNKIAAKKALLTDNKVGEQKASVADFSFIARRSNVNVEKKAQPEPGLFDLCAIL